ncbi:MAG TPA: TIGR01777 family oxidoreductase, partial [Pirellulales bacterium]|nr:TIGR01777 family oxidoreductase [Pirellulales bacterium]
MHRIFERRRTLPVSAQSAFDWHERPGAFQRLTPPWEAVRLVSHEGGIRDGARVVVAIGRWPWQLNWQLEHRDYLYGCQFRDVQIRGPFGFWEHTHRFHDAGPTNCVLEDHIEYRLPLDRWLGPLADPLVRRKLARLFTYRHAVTADDLAALASSPRSSAMRVLVSGASGMVGTALQSLLQLAGDEVRPLAREKHEGDAVIWNPAAGTIDRPALEGFDAVVHLAGENIAAGRWTPAKKARIRDSRVVGTRLLSEALAAQSQKPRVLVCASAIGIYGNRGDEILDESSPPGEGFLADVCREWEAATAAARQAGIRVVNLRFGVILSPTGGALAHMLTPFRLGVGGRMGSGRQYMSWITLDD